MILNWRYHVYLIIVGKWYIAKTRCFGLHFCRRMFTFIFDHFYAMRPASCRVRWNNAKYWLFRRSRSFKVTDFGTNRQLIYDFLLVINTNLPLILHRFWYMASESSKIAIFGYPSCLSTPQGRGSPGTISVKFSVDVNGLPRYQTAKKNCWKFLTAE